MKSEPPTGDELTRLLGSMKRNVLERVAQEPAPAKRKSVRHMLGLGLGVTALLGVGAGAAFALGVITAPEEDCRDRRRRMPRTRHDGIAADRAGDERVRGHAGPARVALRPGLRHPGRSRAGDGPVQRPRSLRSTRSCRSRASASRSRGARDPRRRRLVCEWSNGVPMNEQYGVGPDYVGVTISVVPRAAAGWSENATQHAMPADESQCDGGWCSASSAVGDAWVTVSAFGAGDSRPDPPGWQSLVDAAVGAMDRGRAGCRADHAGADDPAGARGLRCDDPDRRGADRSRRRPMRR